MMIVSLVEQVVDVFLYFFLTFMKTDIVFMTSYIVFRSLTGLLFFQNKNIFHVHKVS